MGLLWGRVLQREMWERGLVLSAPGKVILHGEHAVVHGKVRSPPSPGAPRAPVRLFTSPRLPPLTPLLARRRPWPWRWT